MYQAKSLNRRNDVMDLGKNDFNTTMIGVFVPLRRIDSQ